MTYLNILFGSDVHLKFRLRDTSIATRWAEQLQLAQSLGYPIDDPERFYEFNGHEEAERKALKLVNESISTINSYRPLIDRHLNDVRDQDTLNYLHHIFEVYHGLLDTQVNNDFFKNAPDCVKRALADLNIHVHRCESIGRQECRPRTVITYYGLPKTQKFDTVDYLHFTNNYRFGTVYINYVEIGKALKALAKDNDQYIDDDAFRPYRHFSADFNVKFYDSPPEFEQSSWQLVDDYYTKNQQWFGSRGYHRHDPILATGQLPIADLESTLDKDEIIRSVRDNQIVTRVWLE